MKKLLVLGSSLMLLSTAAFASKARLMALGEDKDGSYYIQDFRNIYINPAHLNTMGNMAVVEWGANGQTFGSASLDADASPKAQGGVVYKLNDTMTMGMVLGDETDVAALTRILSSNGGASAATVMQTADNVIDLFIAGKGDVNWGANLLYTKSNSDVTGSRYDQHAYAVRFGAQKDNWDAHALVALGAEADAPDLTHAPKYEGKLGVRVGGTYGLSDTNKAFLMYEQYSWEQSNNTANGAKRDASFNKWFTGVGHTMKASEKSTLFARGQVEMTTIKLDAISTLRNAEIKRMAVPVTVGYEHAATEWLTFRGSVAHNLYGTVEDSGLTENFAAVAGAGGTTGALIRGLANARYGSSTNGNGGKKTIANSTVVNAGAALTFGNLTVDGLIGTTGGDRAATTVTGNTAGGVFSLDNLMSRVSMTYNF